MSTAAPEQRLRDVAEGKAASAMISMRVKADDARMLMALTKNGESVSEVLRRGMRRVAQEAWEDQLRAEAVALAGEDLNAEADAW